MVSALHIVVRSLHVVGMAFIVGGTVFAWTSLRANTGDTFRLATEYEWMFWAALGVMLVTGVGNLGALGAAAPTTRWGELLTAKLLLVLALIVASFLRTLVVLRLRMHGGDGDASAAILRRLYAVTAGLLLLIVTIAEVLAHG